MKIVSKNQLKNALHYDVFLFILVPCILSVSLFSIFKSKNKEQDYEKIRIFTALEVNGDSNFCNLIEEKFIDQNTKKLEISYVPKNTENIQTIIESKALNDSDILILPETFITNFIGPYLVTFDDSFKNNMIALYPSKSLSYLNLNEESVEYSKAIKIFDCKNSEFNSIYNFSNWFNCNVNENYYITMPTSSMNIGEYSKSNSKHINNKSLDVFKFMLGDKYEEN